MGRFFYGEMGREEGGKNRAKWVREVLSPRRERGFGKFGVHEREDWSEKARAGIQCGLQVCSYFTIFLVILSITPTPLLI